MEDRHALQRGFVAALALVISAIFIWMVRDFLATLFLAGVIALFLSGPHETLAKGLGGRRGIAAGLMVLLTVIAFVVPAVLLIALVVDQAIDVTGRIAPYIREQVEVMRAEGFDGLPDWLPFRETVIQYQAEITARLGDLAGRAGPMTVGILRAGTGGALAAFLNAFILIYALYFFLLTGRRNATAALNLAPMAERDRKLLAERAISTIRATVKGSFVIALIQGTLTGVGLAVAGVPGAVFWAAVVAILSIIPMVGPPLIWIPAAIWLASDGNYVAAGGLAAWGALVVGTLDNILRPILVGQDAKMSDLMVLISTLGGLALFGAVGIIIGPVIAALFISVWFIFRRAFDDFLGPPGKDRQDQPTGTDETAGDPPA